LCERKDTMKKDLVRVQSALVKGSRNRLLAWLAVAVVALPVWAADRTWTGGGSGGNWSDANNWGGTAPGNGDNLTFSGTTRQANTNNLLTSVGNVVIGNGGFSISGNALTLNGDFGNTGNNTWSIPLTLTSSGKSFASLDGTLTLSGNITNGGNTATFEAHYAVGSSGPITVSGILSGTGGLLKQGSGTLTLTRDNTYSGKNTITSGYLAVSKDRNLGAVPGSATINIAFDGGMLETTATFTLDSKRSAKITGIVADGSGFYVDSGTTLTYGGVISGSGSSYTFRLDGRGTIILSSSTSSFTGNTVVYMGVVKISHARALGNSATAYVNVKNLSTLELTGGITVNKPVFLEYANLSSVSGNNTWNGSVTLVINSAGKSVINADSGASLTLAGTVSIVTNPDETDPINTLENLYIEGEGDIEISGAIEGDGTDGSGGSGGYILGHADVVMDGTGTLTLSAEENYYSGRTIVNSGTVAVGADSAFGAVPDSSTDGRIVINGGTLMATADITLEANRGIALGPFTGSGSGTIQVDAGYTVDYAGIIADNDGGTDDFYLTGAGTLILSGENTYSGVTTITDATLQIGHGGTSGSINESSAIVDDGTLAFNRTDTVTQGTHFNSVISGTGAVDQNGSGTVVLNGVNTYSGATTLNAGTLLVNNTTGSGTGSGAATVNNTATLGGNGTISGTLTVASGGRVEPGVAAASVGTLKIGGDVTFESGSTYEVEIGSSTSCDKLDLKGTGALTLGDGVSVLDIGAVTGEGRTIAINIKRDGISGEFDDTAENLLENDSALHLAPNTAYYIHYVNKTATDDGYIVLNTSPTSAEGLILAYATPSGVVVEFGTTEEAGQNDIVLYLFRDGQWVEVGRQASAGEGSHTYWFVVADLNAGDIVSLRVRDDEGQYHTANDLGVGNFSGVAARIAQTAASGLTLRWESIPGRTYDIYRAGQLDGEWEHIRAVEAVQTHTEAVVTIEPFRSAAFFRIGVR
jgi:autotransporter-associated beta strand protein